MDTVHRLPDSDSDCIMDKQHIINEIKRVAEENRGEPLGEVKFRNETGIVKRDWFPDYWNNWGDALVEAGYERKKFGKTYEENWIIEKMIMLIREQGKFPIEAQILRKLKKTDEFPHPQTIRDKLGKNTHKLGRYLNIAKAKKDMKILSKFANPLPQLSKKKMTNLIPQKTI